MSNFTVLLEIGGLAGQRFETIEATVDTGSTLSAAPRALLERVGVRPTRRQRFELASGEIVEHDVGDAWVRIDGVEGATAMIFGGPGEPALLGAVTLETFLFAVDPVHQRLVPISGIRYGRFATLPPLRRVRAGARNANGR